MEEEDAIIKHKNPQMQHTFSKANGAHMDFIKKYLTLSRCDLFFADKVIFVEGVSERLLLVERRTEEIPMSNILAEIGKNNKLV